MTIYEQSIQRIFLYHLVSASFLFSSKPHNQTRMFCFLSLSFSFFHCQQSSKKAGKIPSSNTNMLFYLLCFAECLCGRFNFVFKYYNKNRVLYINVFCHYQYAERLSKVSQKSEMLSKKASSFLL